MLNRHWFDELDALDREQQYVQIGEAFERARTAAQGYLAKTVSLVEFLQALGREDADTALGLACFGDALACGLVDLIALGLVQEQPTLKDGLMLGMREVALSHRLDELCAQAAAAAAEPPGAAQ